MNELNIYKTFQNIFDKSKVIQGRFSIAINYGSDLNNEKVGNYIVETLQPKAYPLVTLFPPVDFPEEKFSDYKLKLVFVLQQGEGSFGIKDSLSNNTTGHPVILDWKDMRECARNFIKILKNVGKIPPVPFAIKSGIIERFSYTGTQKLSGVTLSLDMKVTEQVCDNTEYDEMSRLDLSKLLSTEDIHPQHTH